MGAAKRQGVTVTRAWSGSAGGYLGNLAAGWAQSHPYTYGCVLALGWLIRRPLLAVGLAVGSLFAIDTRSIALALPAAFAPKALWLLARLSWTIRSGSAASCLRDSITGASRARKVRKLWPQAAKAAGLVAKATDLPAPLKLVEFDATRVEFDLDTGAVSAHHDTAVKGATAIAAVVGCNAVEFTTGAHPGLSRMRLRWGDPLSEVVRLDELDEFASSAGWEEDPERVTFGVSNEWDPATLRILTSVLICGESGAGKSGLVWALLAGYIKQGVPVRLRVVDPAGGVELAALSEAGEWVWLVPADKGDDPAGLVQYHGTIRRIVGPADPIGSAPKELERAIRVCRPCLHGERPAFHVHSYTDRASDAKRLFDEQVDAMEARLRSMRRIRVRKHIPSLAEPHDLMIVDELLLLAKLLKEGAESPPGMILTVGRKAAFTVCALSQLPQKDVIGDLRDLFPQRIALAMRSRSMTDAVLGPGAVAAGALAHEIPGSMPGVGFMYSDGTRGYTRIRAALVDDEEADLIARGCLPDGLAVRYVPLPDDLGVAIPYPADPLDDVPIDA